MLCVRRWNDAGPAGRAQVLACTMPRARTGQQKAQLYYEDDKLYPSTLLEKVLVDFALRD